VRSEFTLLLNVEMIAETTDIRTEIGVTIAGVEVVLTTETDDLLIEVSIDVMTEAMEVDDRDPGHHHDEITIEEARHDVPEDELTEQNLV